ncbi:hypothetical protein HanPSC8_Chr15g0656721 [Helianthus annuus]|nr:hypothetical protein HanPSC8_Chr15g0656721 [Helianthus annuus]
MRRAEKMVSTTRFISRQLIMFISIYHPSVHLALDRPHAIIVLAAILPYLLFHLFCNNHKHFFGYVYRVKFLYK